VQVGKGNNVVVTGNGNDNIQAGNGDNLIAAGLGHHTVQVGNGSNILIDGSVQLTQSGDSLRQVLNDWIASGEAAANVASIRSRLAVTYNTHYANVLQAGSGLDWFWATDPKDNLNIKKTDLLN
jgi:Ca2+-binding RTX toxin-like protein